MTDDHLGFPATGSIMSGSVTVEIEQMNNSRNLGG